MAPEALPLDQVEVVIVFGLAIVGYALLTLAAVIAGWGKRAAPGLLSRRKPLAVATLALITGHVGLLWALRYGFDPALAMRNGWLGFASFHVAFVGAWLALSGDFTRPGWRRALLLGAWVLVTSGAVGAPFRYPIVAALALPVVAIAAAGAIGLGTAVIAARRAA